MDIECHVQRGFQAVTYGVFDDLSQKSVDAATDALNALATFWVKPRTPVAVAVQDGQSWRNSDAVGYLQDKVLLLSLAIFTVAILVAGMRMAWEQRARPLQDLLKAMITFVVVCAAGTAVVQILVEWSDEFALNIVQEATRGTSLGTALKDLVLGVGEGGNADPLPLILALILAQTVTFASLIQVALMLIRSAMLVLLAGTLPIAAAATNTEVGKAWFRKYCAWTLAFIAYKPAAALIYAAAIRLKAETIGSDSLVQVMVGMMMLLLAIFALPALLRFAVPVTAAVAGGSAATGSSVADPGGMATGAVNIGRSSFGGGGRGGGGAGASGGGGASGAKVAGSAALGPAAVAVTAARKAAGAVAGAAAHSAGEAGGGSVTPSSFAPRSSGGSKAAPSGSPRCSSGGKSTAKAPEPTGPSGSR